MNDNEIKPLYVPENSGNTLPDLGKHGAHNETPIPLHRTRTEPSRAMSADPMKYLLPSGAELRDIIRRRIKSRPMSAPALWTVLNQSHQTRPRQEQSVIDAVAGMLADGEIEQRDGRLHVAEPEPTVPEIPAEMWTMTQTARLLSVLGTEPRTRAWLAEHTGLKPKQVSKAMGHLIGLGKAEVVGDVPRTWRRTEAKKMDADAVCKAVLKRLGDKVRPEAMIVSDIVSVSDWPVDEAQSLLDDMLACGYVVKHDDGRIGRKNEETEPETAVLTENQTRAVVLERASDVCDADVVIADVMRMSGWDRPEVTRLISEMLDERALCQSWLDHTHRISRPLVRSEDPPPYEIGDDDDGEISEPGIARPEAPTYAPDCVTIEFVSRDSGGYIRAEYSVTLDAEGLQFGAGEMMPFDVVDAVMPTLRRVHRAVFGGNDALE